jgi:thiamine biosynthesis lipoprotein
MPATRLTEVHHIMGMPIGFDVADADGVDLEPALAWLRDVDARLSTYKPDSEICRLDRGELALADVSPPVDEVLVRCAQLRRETRGFFSHRLAGRLDPSGLVKGWAIDGAAQRLAAAGAEAFAINAGGDLVARGRPAEGRRWRIGIRHPEDPSALAAVLAVEDLAVATSGGYERGAHILDPHTGRPAEGLLSVTIVGPDLGTADAYATAAFAMGADGPEWTATLPGYDALCITSDRRVLSTPGFARHRTD